MTIKYQHIRLELPELTYESAAAPEILAIKKIQ